MLFSESIVKSEVSTNPEESARFSFFLKKLKIISLLSYENTAEISFHAVDFVNLKQEYSIN